MRDASERRGIFKQAKRRLNMPPEDDDNNGKVETLKPGQSLMESSFKKMIEEQKKAKKKESEAQAKICAEAFNVLRAALQKQRQIEEEYQALDEDKITLIDLALN